MCWRCISAMTERLLSGKGVSCRATRTSDPGGRRLLSSRATRARAAAGFPRLPKQRFRQVWKSGGFGCPPSLAVATRGGAPAPAEHPGDARCRPSAPPRRPERTDRAFARGRATEGSLASSPRRRRSRPISTSMLRSNGPASRPCVSSRSWSRVSTRLGWVSSTCSSWYSAWLRDTSTPSGEVRFWVRVSSVQPENVNCSDVMSDEGSGSCRTRRSTTLIRASS